MGKIKKLVIWVMLAINYSLTVSPRAFETYIRQKKKKKIVIDSPNLLHKRKRMNEGVFSLRRVVDVNERSTRFSQLLRSPRVRVQSASVFAN